MLAKILVLTGLLVAGCGSGTSTAGPELPVNQPSPVEPVNKGGGR